MDLGRINLRLLRIFDMIFREGSLTLAGQKLGLSQSAVSHALRDLREIFDDPLFVRTAQGMEPTARAREIGGRLPQALMNLEEAVFSHRFDPASTTRTFSIACSDYTSVILIPHLAAALRERAPHAVLRILPMEGRLMTDLDGAKLDLVIAGLTQAPRRMEYEEIFEEELALVSRRGHPLEAGIATMEDVFRFGLVGVDFGLGGDADENECFIRRGQLIQWNNTRFYREEEPQRSKEDFEIVVPNFQSAIHIVKSTDMFTEIGRRLVGLHEADLKIWNDLRSFSGGRLCQLWHSALGNQPAVTWLRQLIREVAGQI